MPRHTTRLAIIIIGTLLLVLIVNILTSPWLEWFTSSDPQTHILLNTSVLNSALVTKDLPAIAPTVSSSLGSRLRQLPSTITRKAVAQTLRTLVIDRAPIHPLFIASLAAGPNDERLIAIGTLTNNQARIGVGLTIASARAQLQQKSTVPIAADQLILSVPSFALNAIPTHLAAQWNTLLSDRLNLIGTHPDILSYLGQFETTQLNIVEENIAIGVTGAVSAFGRTAEQWVQAEEQWQRPEPRTFILPDGGRGVETIPGPVVPVFGPRENGCRGPNNERTIVWLCQSDHYAAISNNQELAHLSPALDKQWHLALHHSLIPPEFCTADQTTALINELICNSNTLAAFGVDNQATIILSFTRADN